MAANQENSKPTTPKWLTADIFENILKEIESGYKSTKNFTVKNALAAGENYATVMLRLEFDIELKDNSSKITTLMIKVPHSFDAYDEWLKGHNIFKIEVEMYYTLIPELEAMYNNVNVDVKLATNCYKLPIEANYVLLRDLRPLGFKNANRLDGLDMEHMQHVLKKMAMLHAASAVRIQSKPYGNEYIYGVYNETIKQFADPMFDGYRKPLLEQVKAFDDSDNCYDVFVNYYDKHIGNLLKSVHIDDNEFNVLNHGDCWTNNIMFQYRDDGKINETYFVDLQMPKYGPPAQDLLYFILTSANFNLKLKKFDYFIKYYHDILAENLKLLNYPKKIPTLKELHQSLIKYGFWGYHTVLMALPPILLDRGNDVSIEGFIDETEAGNNFRIKMVSDSRFTKNFAAIIPWLIYRGAIEL